MVEFDRFDDEELLKRGRDALKLQRYPQAREFLSEYCDRQTKRDLSVPTGILASYALALGHTKGLKEGLELCLKAVVLGSAQPSHLLEPGPALHALGLPEEGGRGAGSRSARDAGSPRPV